MQARVNLSYPWTAVTAFAGREYIKSEWRAVPDGSEEEAGRLVEQGILVLDTARPLEVEETAVPEQPTEKTEDETIRPDQQRSSRRKRGGSNRK